MKNDANIRNFIEITGNLHGKQPEILIFRRKIRLFFKISPFLFGGFRFSSYLCNRLKDDSKLSGRATVSPMAS